MKNNQRGAVPVIVFYIVGGLLLTQLIPNWRLPNLFKKGPPTIELKVAEEAAAKAKADAIAAEARYAAALADERAKTREQLVYAQQMAAGVPVALAKAPQSPEVVLAEGLAHRVTIGLALAIGDLPPSRQAEIMDIVNQALSAKQVEIDAAMAALAAKDKELAVTTEQKKAVEAQLPVLKDRAVSAENKAEAAHGVVVAKTAQVVAYADKAFAKEKEAGSLQAFGDNLLKLLALSAIIALILAGGWLWRHLHSVGISGLKSVVTDIRAGIDPIHALDTVTTPLIQQKVAAYVLPSNPPKTTT